MQIEKLVRNSGLRRDVRKYLQPLALFERIVPESVRLTQADTFGKNTNGGVGTIYRHCRVYFKSWYFY